MVTGMDDCNDEYIVAGAFEYAGKPVNFESFLKLIDGIFNN